MTQTKTNTPILEQVKKAIKEFENTQLKYKSFGAYDTEPDSVWQGLLANAVRGNAPTPPRTGEKWELYANSMDCTEAANALFEAALKAIQTIEGCSIRDIGAIREYVDNYCWRVRY